MASQHVAVIAAYSHGLDGQSLELFGRPELAVQYADEQNAAAEATGVPVVYRVFTLDEVPETALWEWGLRKPDGRVLVYVNERAAGNRLAPVVELVRRRLGSKEWEVVTAEPVGGGR